MMAESLFFAMASGGLRRERGHRDLSNDVCEYVAQRIPLIVAFHWRRRLYPLPELILSRNVDAAGLVEQFSGVASLVFAALV
jgi:hypothetical protein